jgi:AraC-like DNA-binding protein
LLKNNDYISDFEYPEYINDIFHRIDHFYNKKYTLDKLAKLYSINKFHLAREFKKYSGTTLNEYLITTRIDRAKQFLRYSKKSIEQIAQEVGFYNSSHFIKMFHTREHITPLSYRKQWTCSIS